MLGAALESDQALETDFICSTVTKLGGRGESVVVGLGGKLESLCIRQSRFCLDDILRRKWREEKKSRYY